MRARSDQWPWLGVGLLALGLGAGPARADPDTVKVAAVHYTGQAPSSVDPDCNKTDVNCAVESLVRRAHDAGAQLIVLAEYGLQQDFAEPDPDVGTIINDPDAPVSGHFASLAGELKTYLVINLETVLDDKRFNTQIAFGPSGKVLAKHHKFELFEGENRKLSRGDDVSAFDTPFGRVGLLICADIYGDPRFHDKLTGSLKANIIAFSEMWTVRDAVKWPAAFARDWNVTVIASNASRGEGEGSGIFSPDKVLGTSKPGTPGIVVATIPRQPH